MQYEISCFINLPVAHGQMMDMKAERLARTIEGIIADFEADFTIELRNLKAGSRVFHGVHFHRPAWEAVVSDGVSPLQRRDDLP